jgi:hypothetical protein
MMRSKTVDTLMLITSRKIELLINADETLYHFKHTLISQESGSSDVAFEESTLKTRCEIEP